MLTYSISKYYAVTRQKRRTRQCFPPCSRIRHSKKGKRIRRTFLMANTPPYGQPQNGQPQYNQPPQPQAPNYSQPQPGGPQYGQPQPMPYGQPQQYGQPQPYGQPQLPMPQYGQPRPMPYGQPAMPPAHRVSTGGSTACDATICPIATIRSAATANARQLSFPASRRRGQK